MREGARKRPLFSFGLMAGPCADQGPREIMAASFAARVRPMTSLAQTSTATTNQTTDIAAALARIRGIVGDRLTTSMAVRTHHGTDSSWHAPHPPEAVVFGHSTEEISQIAR